MNHPDFVTNFLNIDDGLAISIKGESNDRTVSYSKSINHITTLIAKGADAFVIGEQKFGLRLAGEFNRDAMRELYH